MAGSHQISQLCQQDASVLGTMSPGAGDNEWGSHRQSPSLSLPHGFSNCSFTQTRRRENGKGSIGNAHRADRMPRPWQMQQQIGAASRPDNAHARACAHRHARTPSCTFCSTSLRPWIPLPEEPLAGPCSSFAVQSELYKPQPHCTVITPASLLVSRAATW